MQEAYALAERPYLVLADLYTFREQHQCAAETYQALTKVSTDQRRPVLLEVVAFHAEYSELHIDLTDCHRAMSWDYRKSLTEMA